MKPISKYLYSLLLLTAATMPANAADGIVTYHLSTNFVDRSSIELFAGNGRSVMTNLVFHSTPYTMLSVSADGGKAKVGNMKVYAIK